MLPPPPKAATFVRSELSSFFFLELGLFVMLLSYCTVTSVIPKVCLLTLVISFRELSSWVLLMVVFLTVELMSCMRELFFERSKSTDFLTLKLDLFDMALSFDGTMFMDLLRLEEELIILFC